MDFGKKKPRKKGKKRLKTTAQAPVNQETTSSSGLSIGLNTGNVRRIGFTTNFGTYGVRKIGPRPLYNNFDLNTTLAQEDTVEEEENEVVLDPNIESNTDQTNNNSVPEQEPEIPQYPSASSRGDISVWTPFTQEQKEKYRWDEIYLLFKAANPGIGATLLSQWIRKSLKDGWMYGEDSPSIKSVVPTTNEKGIPVFEAFTFEDAWNAAEKILPANVGATFIWKTKLTGKESITKLNFASDKAFTNFKLNQNKTVDFEALLQISGDKYSYGQVKKIKNYRDQLLSDYLLTLIANAQREVYGVKDKSKQTGIYTEQFEIDLHSKVQAIAAEKQQQEANRQQQEALNKQKKETGVIDPKNPGRIIFLVSAKGGEKEVSVNKKMLEGLKEAIKAGDKDDIVDYIDIWLKQSSQITETEIGSVLLVLKIDERISLLESYSSEMWLFEDQEKIVNQLIQVTPEDQKQELKAYLFKDNFAKFHRFKDLVENDETNKEFFTSVEQGTNVVFLGDVNKLKQELNKMDIQAVTEILNKLSDEQNSHIDLDTRLRIFEKYDRNFQTHPRLFINIPPNQREKFKVELRANGLKKLVSTYYKATDSQEGLLRRAFNELFKGDSAVIGELFAANDIESAGKYVPETVLELLSVSQRLELIKRIMKGHVLDSDDEETVIRIVESTKTGREELYKQLQPILPDLFRGYDNLIGDDNYYRLHQAVNELDPKASTRGAINRVQSTRAAEENNLLDTQTDAEIAKLSKSNMAALDLDTRKKYIQYILGKNTESMDIFLASMEDVDPNSIFDTGLSRVGARDEESLLRLINTTPGKDVPDLLSWLQNNNGKFYNRLEDAIDGPQYKELHEHLQNASNLKLAADMEVRGPEAEKAQGEEFIRMKQEGVRHPKVVPWSDPGMLDVRATFKFEFHIEWEGKKMKVWYTDVNRPVPGQYAAPKTFDPWDMIGVHFLRDDTDIGAKQGEVKIVPAIYLFFLENKQTNRQIGEAVDIAAIIIGVYELRAAATLAEALIAMADIALSAGSLVVSSYEDALSPEMREIWDDVNKAFMFYMLGKGGIHTVKKYGPKLNILRKALANSGIDLLNKTILRGKLDAFDKMVELAGRIENAGADELAIMRGELDDALSKPGLPESDRKLLENTRNEITDRLNKATGDELVKQQQLQQQKIQKEQPVIEKQEIPEAIVPAIKETPPLTIRVEAQDLWDAARRGQIEGATETAITRLVELGLERKLFSNEEEFLLYLKKEFPADHEVLRYGDNQLTNLFKQGESRFVARTKQLPNELTQVNDASGGSYIADKSIAATEAFNKSSENLKEAFLNMFRKEGDKVTIDFHSTAFDNVAKRGFGISDEFDKAVHEFIVKSINAGFWKTADGVEKLLEKIADSLKSLGIDFTKVEKVNYKGKEMSLLEYLTLKLGEISGGSKAIVPEATREQNLLLQSITSKINGLNEGSQEWRRIEEYLLISTGGASKVGTRRENLDAALSRLKDADIKNMDELNEFLDRTIREHGLSKNRDIIEDVYKGQDGLWKVKTKKGEVIEYSIGSYYELGKKGTDSFFQAHHGIQDKWGIKALNKWIESKNIDLGLINYSSDSCPAINLRDSRRGSPHQIITGIQKAREATLIGQSYEKMRELLLSDLKASNVPDEFILRLLDESDKYFSNIYDKLRDELIRKGNSQIESETLLKEIFGNFKP